MNINDKFLDPQGHLMRFRPTDNLQPLEKGFEIRLSSVADKPKGWIKHGEAERVDP